MLLKRIEQWDQASFCRLFNHGSSRLMFMLSFCLSKTADGPLYLLIAAAMLSLDMPSAAAFVQLALCSFAIELPLYLLLKHSIKRARPADVLQTFIHAHIVPSDRFSLPSGHTAGAFVMACAATVYFPLLMPLTLGWACAIGLSRIMLGVHFPLDIIAGALLGSGSVFAAFLLINE